jgi:pyruvate/2-oxoglutarate dehydrogenase complex dihydrolipoamide dehydrogenase (E3) component
MVNGVASLFKANGVEWVKGLGRFKDANTIAVEGGEDVTFKSAVVATGSFPLRPPIEGSTRRGASTRRDFWLRSRCRAGSSCSAAGSSAASSRRSSGGSAPR